MAKDCGCNKKKKTPEVREQYKPEEASLPSLTTRAFNFAKSATNYVRSGMENVTGDVYNTRLKICNDCPFRKDSTCTKCGCFIEVKAKWKVSECPEKRWPEVLKN